MSKLFSIFNIKRLIECRSLATRISADGKAVPKKIPQNIITLISTDSSISITDLKSAQSISERRDLKLVKVEDADSKTKRPVYKLMTKAEYHEEEMRSRKERQNERHKATIKGEKLLTLSSRIGEHDLMTGVKKMIKLLEKQYQVRVVIAAEGGEMEQAESITSVIEKNIKSVGRVLQKRTKGSSVKFQLQPIKASAGATQTSNAHLDSNKNDSDKGPL